MSRGFFERERGTRIRDLRREPAGVRYGEHAQLFGERRSSAETYTLRRETYSRNRRGLR
jgi:hypothetical protein